MPTKKQLEEARRLASDLDWSKFASMTEDEIRRHWSWDNDTAWPSRAELKEFDLVVPRKRRRVPAGN